MLKTLGVLVLCAFLGMFFLILGVSLWFYGQYIYFVAVFVGLPHFKALWVSIFCVLLSVGVGIRGLVDD